MSQKQIAILVALIFTAVAVATLVNWRREAEIGDRLARVDAASLVGVRVSGDGFERSIEDPAQLEALAAALRGLEPSSLTIKSLEVVADIDIDLELEPDDHLTLSVMRTVEQGEVGVVSIARWVGPGTVPGGIFESAELLAWVEAAGYESTP